MQSLIEAYTSKVPPDLKIRMLPFVLALVITTQKKFPRNDDQLSKDITLITREIPGLDQLYCGFSDQKIPFPAKRFLTFFLENIKKNPELTTTANDMTWSQV